MFVNAKIFVNLDTIDILCCEKIFELASVKCHSYPYTVASYFTALVSSYPSVRKHHNNEVIPTLATFLRIFFCQCFLFPCD